MLKRMVLIFVALSTVSLTACSEFLKGKPTKQDVIEKDSQEVACVKDLSDDFKSLLDSKLSEKEIDEAFECIDKTLNQFQSRVQGKEKADAFTSKELHSIFEKVLKDKKISEEATKDILVLKKALIGGSDQAVTKAELATLRAYLAVLEPEVKKLSPYVKMFSFKKTNGPFSQETLKIAFDQLRASLKVLLGASKLVKSEYNFEDLKNLLIHLNVIEDDQKDLVALAEKVKQLLLGADSLKTTADYELAIDNFVGVASIYAQTVYSEIHFDIKSSPQVDQAVRFVESVVATLENSVQFKVKGEIHLRFVDLVLEDLFKTETSSGKKVLPFEVSFPTFKVFYRKILTRVFSDQKSLTADEVDSLRSVHFKYIKREIAILKLYLKFLSSIKFDNNGFIKAPFFQDQFKVYMASENKEILSAFGDDEVKIILSGLESLRQESLSSRPILYWQKKMGVAVNQEIWSQSWEDLARALYGKMLARELMLGWGKINEMRDVAKAVLAEAGLSQWYSDFKQFCVEMRIFDPASDNSGPQSFQQANLFTYAANGDDKMSFDETMQFVNMLLTGGGQITTDMRDGLAKAGCNRPQKDDFGYFWNDEECFIKDFKVNYKKYFSNLPYFTGYLDQLLNSDVVFQDYMRTILDVARSEDKKDRFGIETADIRNLATTIVYIEALYAQFDTDRNWTLSPKEIRAAYPRFKSFATDYANKTSQLKIQLFGALPLCKLPIGNKFSEEDLIRESFIYLVYHGQTPEMKDVNYISCSFGKELITFTGEVDRKTIISTFKILKSVLASKK